MARSNLYLCTYYMWAEKEKYIKECNNNNNLSQSSVLYFTAFRINDFLCMMKRKMIESLSYTFISYMYLIFAAEAEVAWYFSQFHFTVCTDFVRSGSLNTFEILSFWSFEIHRIFNARHALASAHPYRYMCIYVRAMYNNVLCTYVSFSYANAFMYISFLMFLFANR